ncbi:MAG TPA: OmpA family protein [Polyangiaceae bacterium]|nr:OmpA family protein [Polyangiaceae bacterium]
MNRLAPLALAAAAFASFAAYSAPASAQESLGGYALDQFDPAPAGDDFWQVPAATANGHLELRGYVMFDYAVEPLRLGTGEDVVSGQGFLRGDVSFALFNRLLLSLDLPVAIIQSGDSPTVGIVTLASPDGAELGDLRFGVRTRIYGEYRDPFQIGAGASVFFPTAGTDSFAGEGTMRLHPELSLGGRYGGEHAFFWGAAGGMMMRGPENPHTMTYSGGVGVALADDMVDLTAEVFGATQLESQSPLASPRVTVEVPTTTSIEMLGGAKLRVLDGLVFGAGAGPGMSHGIGTPSARVVGMIGWEPVPPRDRSGEDDDGDGVLNGKDACIDQKGVSSIDPKRNGCPGDVDTDLDGIADKEDACPKVKGSHNEDLSKNGCPTQDGDADGIADIDDACPNERGLPNTDKSKNGCPKDVRVTTQEIVILRQVHFKLGKSSLDQTVDPVSDDLLTEVRDVILQHPEIQVIEVQGHADDTGTAEFNKQLSQQRATAVRSWLVRKGIDGKRLVATGYGATRPVASNQTDEGRAQNRRVQFVIVRKASSDKK